MPGAESLGGCFLRLAGRENISAESEKKRTGRNGQGGILPAPAAIWCQKNQCRTQSVGISRRAKIGGFVDEKAIFDGD